MDSSDKNVSYTLTKYSLICDWPPFKYFHSLFSKNVEIATVGTLSSKFSLIWSSCSQQVKNVNILQTDNKYYEKHNLTCDSGEFNTERVKN